MEILTKEIIQELLTIEQDPCLSLKRFGFF